jgi:transcription elongation GreA/GreB family factor
MSRGREEVRTDKEESKRYKALNGEQSVRQRRCRSSGAQRAETIGIRTAAGSDQLHHFARKTLAGNVSPNSNIFSLSVHVVNPPEAPSNSVTFGATVTVKDKEGGTETFTIVGVDELNFEPDAVSWISPVGKALLAADMGNWIKLEDGRNAKIVKIGFKRTDE